MLDDAPRLEAAVKLCLDAWSPLFRVPCPAGLYIGCQGRRDVAVLTRYVELSLPRRRLLVPPATRTVIYATAVAQVSKPSLQHVLMRKNLLLRHTCFWPPSPIRVQQPLQGHASLRLIHEFLHEREGHRRCIFLFIIKLYGQVTSAPYMFYWILLYIFCGAHTTARPLATAACDTTLFYM